MGKRVMVTEEIAHVWEFTVEEFIETYRDEWEREVRIRDEEMREDPPDPEEWVRESIEELGSDQLDRVTARQRDDHDLIVRITDG